MTVHILRRRRVLVTILFVLFISYYIDVSAQEYYFSVPRVEFVAQVQPDGSVVLHYWMDFQNSVTGHAIDIVDVGLPQDGFEENQTRAWVNGEPAPGPIRNSQYVKPGLEVHLGHLQIPANGSGTFEFQTVLHDLLFQDTTRKDYASFQITPTYFGEQYVEGSTNLKIRVILPAGLKPEEVLYQDVPFTSKQVLGEGTIELGWEVNRRFTAPYRVGVSFPKRVVQNVVQLSILDLAMRWWRGMFSPQTRIYITAGAAIALLLIYMRFTGGTGCIFFIPMLIAGAFFFIKLDAAEILIWPILLVLAVIVETARKKRRSKYLPAIASVEGGGIKRGLTAPEAAVLLELPVNKVVTLVLFGMLKKGVIQQVSKDPMLFEIERDAPPDAVRHDYEKEFLKHLKQWEGAKTDPNDFSKPMKALVDSVAKRLVGYNLDESREYYKQIISRAWKEAQEIGEVEVWQKKMDEKVDWMMLDPDFGGRFRPYQDRYIPRPYRGTTISTSGAGSSSEKSSSPQGTRFSDVAASVSGWFENTAGTVVSTVEGQKGGIVNFGSIDKAVGKAMASSGRGSGGGGGGCACACAGCACACACAGGGR
jgi:hypothetical protein